MALVIPINVQAIDFLGDRHIHLIYDRANGRSKLFHAHYLKGNKKERIKIG